MKYSLAKVLWEALEPHYLSIYDDSSAHLKHKGVSATKDTHFHIVIVSKSFSGHSLVDRHKMVYKLCESFFSDGMHALKLKLLSEKEW